MNKKWHMDQEKDFDEEIRHIFQEPVEIPEAVRQAKRQARNIIHNNIYSIQYILIYRLNSINIL